MTPFRRRVVRRLARLRRDPAGFALDLPNPTLRALARFDLIVAMAVGDLIDLKFFRTSKI